MLVFSRLDSLLHSTAGIVAFCLLLTGQNAAAGAAPAMPSAHPDTWATPVDKSINLHRMSPTLYRSALPNRQSMSLLQTLQVRTVVSFVKDDDAEWLGNAAVERVSIPLHADRVKDADVLRVLRVVRDAETRGPVLMHCKHGRERTGLMAAMYRTVIQGWSKEEALREMHNGGFGDEKDIVDATRYVEKADIAKIRQALADGKCSTTLLSTCYVRDWYQKTFGSASKTALTQ
ncbi:Protein tyrosine/serine phosphatase [Aromatoleum tolulyticum]|uniref:Protein tyrosine/serine phosphatase n=1 Tax=Aromatoleum tolulyticum TaxID=34027 RepID=A0A1N6W7A9_9RHOO|nr:tyrosine-protein phosphatase [Aromatoleum tolulyticum]SIQ86017.1 Protein tyrosine/serine phosphatase [Aromatoleum tolulyticum]